MKAIPTDERHRAWRDGLLALVETHRQSVDAEEMLAISAHMVGQIIALMDQTRFTPEMVWAIVNENILAGNQAALASILGQPVAGNA